jgi:uncharacterized protein YycO
MPHQHRNLRIALFRGRGFFSTLIRWQTDGRYAHAAFVLPSGKLIESWQGDGVREKWLEDREGVEVFEIAGMTSAQSLAIENWLEGKKGLEYDWRGVFRFLSRRKPKKENNKWFCSELVFQGCAKAGIALLARTKAVEVSPALLARSPFLLRTANDLPTEKSTKHN